MESIIIVEDEPLLGKTLQASLTDDGYKVHLVVSAEEGLTWLDGRQVDLALIDVGLPGIDGTELLRRMSTSHPGTAVVIMTANDDVPTAVNAMKAGAADFLLKPLDLDTVSIIVRKNLRHGRLVRAWSHEQQQRTQQFGLHQLIGECPEIEKAKAMARRICRLDVPAGAVPPNILITGETGTGKDLLAKAIHYEGPRNNGPFVHLNCAALPDTLAESELFGHTKGAFTSARANKRGLFEVADQGTLFLNEVGSLHPTVQAKLLTAIETGRIRPLGSVEESAFNIQLIAAMNQDPVQHVRTGTLRDDLFHRLRGLHIHLPPLRERGKDLQLLADHLITRHCHNFGMPVRKLTDEGRKALQAYAWPGNVRELSHRLESAVLLAHGAIGSDLLPASGSHAVASERGSGQDRIEIDFSHGPMPLADVEKRLIVAAMTASNNNVTRAAQLLAISRDTLRYRLEKYGISLSAHTNPARMRKSMLPP